MSRNLSYNHQHGQKLMNRDVHLHGIVLTGRIESNLKAVVL